MDIHRIKAINHRVEGTLRYTAGKVAGDRHMQTQKGVEIAIRHHVELSPARNVIPDAKT